MVAPDFCSAKMAQVYRLVESLLQMYKVCGNGKKTLSETLVQCLECCLSNLLRSI